MHFRVIRVLLISFSLALILCLSLIRLEVCAIDIICIWMRTYINVYMFVHECVYVLVFVYGWRIHICVICVQINDRVCSAIDDLFTFHVVLLRVVWSWLCLMG